MVVSVKEQLWQPAVKKNISKTGELNLLSKIGVDFFMLKFIKRAAGIQRLFCFQASKFFRDEEWV